MDNFLGRFSILLELAALDDVVAFRKQVEDYGADVNEESYWYGRVLGSKKMRFELRTPSAIAAMFGNVAVLKYIISTGLVDINKASGTDRATPLHCAVAGGAPSMLETVKLLVHAAADVDAPDSCGNSSRDLLKDVLGLASTKRKLVESVLKGESLSEDEEEKLLATPRVSDKKEYPIDVSLPDINNGIYSTDEFRMYSFKVKPCSRAYSHDWTECPFVHPGENARRRDPRKYPYSCVPCPEFRKGACQKGDACEYAHGVFESWLHPSQYRTRLCKDETGCARKVCFFAHKVDELRPVYASTGSAIPSPRSLSLSLSSDMVPLNIGSPSSSPKSGNPWQSRATPPALQLPGSRLKAALNARDLDLELELIGLENQQQQLIEELSGVSSPSRFARVSDLKPTNLEDVLGAMDPSLMSPIHLQSPTGMQMRQSMNPLRASYPTALSSSPGRNAPSFGFDSSAAVAAAVMNSRSSAFSKRSQSFIDRSGRLGLTVAANSMSMANSNLSGWSSPDGRLDWGVQGDEVNKMSRSASFGFRQRPAPPCGDFTADYSDEPDVSWVNTLVKDGGVHDQIPSWMEQIYTEQEQMVA